MSKNKRWEPRKTPEILLPRADVTYVKVKCGKENGYTPTDRLPCLPFTFTEIKF